MSEVETLPNELKEPQTIEDYKPYVNHFNDYIVVELKKFIKKHPKVGGKVDVVIIFEENFPMKRNSDEVCKSDKVVIFTFKDASNLSKYRIFVLPRVDFDAFHIFTFDDLESYEYI